MKNEAARQYHRSCVETAQRHRHEIGYNPQRWLQMVSEYGAVDAAARLVTTPGYSDGFTKLWEHNRLHESVEASVLLPWFADLFTNDVRTRARQLLEEYGFDVDRFRKQADQSPPDWSQLRDQDAADHGIEE